MKEQLLKVLSRFQSRNKTEKTDDEVLTVHEHDAIAEPEMEESPATIAETLGKIPRSMVNASQEEKDHINTLRYVIIGQMVIIGILAFALAVLPKQIPIRRVPDLSNPNSTEKIGHIAKHSIFTEASYLWRELNQWKVSGEKDATSRLFDYEFYFSESFVDQLEMDYANMMQTGELKRTRSLIEVPGQLHEIDKRVVQKSESSWVVYIDMTLKETFLGKVIREDDYRYSFLVERYNTTFDENPLGLRIVGFEKSPVKLMKSR